MKQDTIKLIQQGLNKHFKQKLYIDGKVGRKTYLAISKVSLIPNHWGNNRKLVGFIQVLALVEGFNAGPIDGHIGPQTLYALDLLETLFRTGKKDDNWRDESEIIETQKDPFVPLQNYKDMVRYYGEVGTNQTKVQLPHPVRIAWDLNKKITRFTCHEKVADSIARVLTRVVDYYGPEQYVKLGLDIWAGTLNVRKIRGGRSYSIHSWGVAIDWMSEQNQLRWGKNRALLAKPIYNKWWELWEEERWVSLGREKNFDWMHCQRARLR
jgi:hypothetical protein